jgi:S-adenosylmethionine synthetase
MSYLFTSESVSEGHPDKIADAISDTVLDLVMAKQDSALRCACETLVTTNRVVIAGEYKGVLQSEDVDIAVRDVIKEIGYEQSGFDWRTVEITNLLHGEDWLGPDAKSQVTFEYHDDGTPVRIAKIVCSTQHSDLVDIDHVRLTVKNIILSILPTKYIDNSTEFYINPTGRFVIGGPDGDTGLTGRKIIVDTYGGSCPHGGGAFSGKDPTKVDRSAAYMMRYLAKNIVASGQATRATCQISYAIGVVQPMSFYVQSDGNSQAITNWIQDNVDLTPAGIIKRFDLFRPIYRSTTNYGHFGKDYLPWEKLDLI